MRIKNPINYEQETSLEHIVTDMGNGGAYCLLCGEHQSKYFEKRFESLDLIKKREAMLGIPLTTEELLQIWKQTNRCEHCGALFTKESTWISPGGSDF